MYKFLLFFSLFSTSLFADKIYEQEIIADVVYLYDGDTLFVSIPEWPPIIGETIGVRVYGVDCPEIRSNRPKEKEKAQQAKKFVENLIKKANNKITIKNIRRDKYFRLLGDVYIGDKLLSKELIDNDLGKPYFGGTK